MPTRLLFEMEIATRLQNLGESVRISTEKGTSQSILCLPIPTYRSIVEQIVPFNLGVTTDQKGNFQIQTS